MTAGLHILCMYLWGDGDEATCLGLDGSHSWRISFSFIDIGG